MKILRESSKILVLNRMYNSNSSSNTNWKIIKNNKLSKIYNIYRKTHNNYKIFWSNLESV